MRITKSIVALLFLVVFAAIPSFAQQLFTVTITLPDALPASKVQVWLDDMRGDRPLKPSRSSALSLQFSDTLYAAYAVIHLQVKPAPGEKYVGQTFFAGAEPANIVIHPYTDAKRPFANYTLTNAFDFDSDRMEMERFVEPAAKKEMDYYAANKRQLDEGNAEAWKPFNELRKNRQLAQLQYVSEHPDRYRSFYIFRSMLYKYKIVSPDSMYGIFMKFPERFRHTGEGSMIAAYLRGLDAVSSKGVAPDFMARDISANAVVLSSFRGKKMVLLHFWATWCGPCLEELPGLKALHERYRSKGFEIISIAYRSQKDEDYLPVVVANKMDWLNIYDDVKITNAFGQPVTPQLLLIDKAGMIVFDSILYKGKDAVLAALNDLLSKSL